MCHFIENKSVVASCSGKGGRAHGASVGVSGLEGGSGISIKVGVAMLDSL